MGSNAPVGGETAEGNVRWPVVIAAVIGGAVGGAVGGYAGTQAGSDNADAQQEQPQDPTD